MGVVGWWWCPAAVLVVVGVAAAGVLYSRRHRHEHDPDESTDMAARAVAAAPSGIVVVRADGAVLLANDVARRFGLVTHDDALHPQVVERALGRAAQATGADAWEAPGLRGRTEVVNMTAQALGDRLALVTATDESASRAAERMRRDFVANVSHELKSPVTALGLLAEAVLEAADSPDAVVSFGQRMRRESARLGTLITEIIALSAIQGGGLHDVSTVPMDQVVQDAVDRAAVSASSAQIAVHVGSASGAEVTGDKGLLTTAVGNLVGNAVHYSEPGSVVTVTQTVRRGIVDIAVADTGIGIAFADQRRVFERFFRADPARSRATGGTGLGLAIVKHVAANHGGSIRLVSKLGVGSTFTLRLPLAGTAPTPTLITDLDGPVVVLGDEPSDESGAIRLEENT